MECTSQVFEGLITLADPGTSWVARWQRLDGYVPGTYAVKVQGSVRYTPGTELLYLCDWDHRTDWWCLQLPQDILGALEDRGVKYIP